jgi:molecular chaperone Hsp33
MLGRFNIECSGPIKGLVVEATAYGRVRGYLKQVPIPLTSPLDSFDLAPFFGAGFLEVTRYLTDAKQPFSGKIMLQYGNIAQDIANYYLTSEQIPTAMAVSVQFDQEGRVVGAGGLFLQAMPNADENLMSELEKCMGTMPALGQYFAADSTVEQLLADHFGPFSPQFLANGEIEFSCNCSEQRIREMLLGLPVEDLADMQKNGPFPVDVRCHFCNSCYSFDHEAMANIRQEK